MEARSTDKKSFQLLENGRKQGELIYENLFFLTAEISLIPAERYEIKPVGIWGTSIAVTKNGAEIARLKMNWRGQILFSFKDGRTLALKAKGVLSNQFILENQNGEKLLQLDPTFNWSKFNYNYSISYKKIPDALLVLLGIYASNYFIASMSGAFAGIT